MRVDRVGRALGAAGVIGAVAFAPACSGDEESAPTASASAGDAAAPSVPPPPPQATLPDGAAPIGETPTSFRPPAEVPPPNGELFGDPGFEAAVQRCGPGFGDDGSSVISVTTSGVHAGSQACSVCKRPGATATTFSLEFVPFAGSTEQGSYKFVAYVRAPAATGITKIQVSYQFQSDIMAGFPTAATITPTGGWDKLSATISLGLDTRLVRVDIMATGDVGDCFVVDDATLTLVPK